MEFLLGLFLVIGGMWSLAAAKHKENAIIYALVVALGAVLVLR